MSSSNSNIIKMNFNPNRDANEKKLIQVLKIPTEHNVADLLTKSFDVTRFGYVVVNIVSACLVCWTNLLQGNIIHLWFLFTSAGRVTFCWLFPIPAGVLVSAGHMVFMLAMYFSCWYMTVTADDVDINTLTLVQAWIQDDIRPGVVKPKIKNDIEFEINSNFEMD
uniref:Putative ribonuclease H-like domain-containing protein n=1 Tax=Tanacetum cinerariifolium TaxID=118510 RepID=A0A6L2LX42_TANCI|nr:putative ribonuclease H-like domain-containing protein [Tanacetum cinerariifolium]